MEPANQAGDGVGGGGDENFSSSRIKAQTGKKSFIEKKKEDKKGSVLLSERGKEGRGGGPDAVL